MNQMLMRGTPQDWIGATFAERMADIARRKETIVGVSEFPDLSEKPRRLEEIDVGPLEAHAKALLGDARDTRGIPFAELVERSLEGEAFIYRGRLASFTALPPRRLGEAFEDLRDRADARLAATGQPPKIFLACLGTAAEHGARLGFARGLFAAGGIEGIEGRGDPAEVAAAWRASGAVLAAVCAGDEALEQSGAAAVSALVGAGCERVWVMGRPPEASPGLVEAGAAACVRAGDDILAILEDAYAYLDENP